MVYIFPRVIFPRPSSAWGSKVTTTGKTHGASSTPFYEFKIRWRSILTSSEIYAFLYGFNTSNSTLDYEIDYQRMRTYFLLLGTIVSGQRLNLCQREINQGRNWTCDHWWDKSNGSCEFQCCDRCLRRLSVIDSAIQVLPQYKFIFRPVSTISLKD